MAIQDKRQPRRSRFIDYLLFLLIAIGVALFGRSCCKGDCYRQVYGAKKDQTEFVDGLNYGKAFLRAKSKKGKKYRAGLNKMHERYGPWCWKYMPRDYVACLSRIWLESRGNPWSHTKDTQLLEAGLTSVSRSTAYRLCKQGGVCGDPCGDPEFSITASAWRGREQRRNMLEGVKDPEAPVPEPTFWASWLPEQLEENRIEAEYFMSLCGGINCQKLRKALKYANAETGLLKNKHRWWKLMLWLRSKSHDYLVNLFNPLKISIWRFGSRWGRVMGQWNIRAEFFPPLGNDEKNYCWGTEPYYYPQIHIPGEGQKDLFPKPLFKYPKKGTWRDRCVLYSTKAWHKIWDEPKRNDRYKKKACRDGVCWKAKEKKYKTDADFEAAHAAWIDEQQTQGLLPSDGEYAVWEDQMRAAGCEFIYEVE